MKKFVESFEKFVLIIYFNIVRWKVLNFRCYMKLLESFLNVFIKSFGIFCNFFHHTFPVLAFPKQGEKLIKRNKLLFHFFFCRQSIKEK